MTPRNRDRIAFTVDPKVISDLRTYSKTTMIPLSRIAERAITEYLARRTQQPRTDARGSE